MAIELEFNSIIIPIENIQRCEKLGGFERFIASQKDQIGYNVWYDEHLYRCRVPYSSDEDVDRFRYWKELGLEPFSQDSSDDGEYRWQDFCEVDESGPGGECDWLEFDEDVPCVWLKGKPRGKLFGSNRRNSKLTSVNIIDRAYTDKLLEKINTFRINIGTIPPMLLHCSKFDNALQEWIYPLREALDARDSSETLLLRVLRSGIYYFLLMISPAPGLVARLIPRFNPNHYFEIFDLLKIDKGFTLDYEYCGDHPIVYSREVFPFNLYRQKRKNDFDFFNESHNEAIDNISVTQSPKGLMQFVVFSVLVSQFYLYWHALENDETFICSRSQIDGILRKIVRREVEQAVRERQPDDLSQEEMEQKVESEFAVLFDHKESDDDLSPYLGPVFEDYMVNGETKEKVSYKRYWTTKEDLKRLFDASLEPSVSMTDNGYAVVKIMTFSDWSGFRYRLHYIRYPNILEKTSYEKILDYDCGITF